MAISVVGGVTVSTFLTLYVVPCAYSLASRLESKKHETNLELALVTMEEMESTAREVRRRQYLHLDTAAPNGHAPAPAPRPHA